MMMTLVSIFIRIQRKNIESSRHSLQVKMYSTDSNHFQSSNIGVFTNVGLISDLGKSTR